jgi:hypothetical protein
MLSSDDNLQEESGNEHGAGKPESELLNYVATHLISIIHESK